MSASARTQSVTEKYVYATTIRSKPQPHRRRGTVCYSVGRSQYQVHDTIKTLLARADDVLYAEKEARTQTSLLPEASKRSASAARNQGRAVPLSSGRTAAMAEVDGAAYS